MHNSPVRYSCDASVTRCNVFEGWYMEFSVYVNEIAKEKQPLVVDDLRNSYRIGSVFGLCF